MKDNYHSNNHGQQSSCGCNAGRREECITIKECAEKCKSTGALCATSVETMAAARDLRNVVVTVTDINTVFNVDDRGGLTRLWKGDLEIDNYDPVVNPLNLKSQTLFDKINNVAYRFFLDGSYKEWDLE